MTSLAARATHLVSGGRGILAADESIPTMSKRLLDAGVEPSAEVRRDYRVLLLTTPGLTQWVTGIILCDETLQQCLADGTPIVEVSQSFGIECGIKVDTGVVPLPFSDIGGITEGLDGLMARLERYRSLGASFAKWRAVLPPVGLGARCVEANAHALARYAACCQAADLVPIVEPEVLMDGNHDLATCKQATRVTLRSVMSQLQLMGADPAALILKPNMVVPGSTRLAQTTPTAVAAATLYVLRSEVPAAVAGIAFLSGGQSNEQACANLAAINQRAAADGGALWPLTFSFGRALVNDALRTWHGERETVDDAQAALTANCRRAAAAATSPGADPPPMRPGRPTRAD
jgi:fructose-bisphosphate aldolase class I